VSHEHLEKQYFADAAVHQAPAPHAEFWAAVGRREADQWECKHVDWRDDCYKEAEWWLSEIYKAPDKYILRRKPRAIVVNGVGCVAGHVGEIATGTQYAYPESTLPHGYRIDSWCEAVIDVRRRTYVGIYIGPDKEAHAGAVGKAMRLHTETKS